MNILHTIVDQGVSISILYSITWKATSSPQLVPITNQIQNFNTRATITLGILPHLPIILGGKIVSIDVMVVQGPLDFNMFLG